MTTLDKLNQAQNAPVRNSKLITQLFRQCVFIEGYELDIEDYS